MVTGEQAFAVLEAVHTLDVSGLHARYSEECMADVCDIYDIDMRDAFEFAVDRGWSLPFGVRTFLRVEQEDELIEPQGHQDNEPYNNSITAFTLLINNLSHCFKSTATSELSHLNYERSEDGWMVEANRMLFSRSVSRVETPQESEQNI
ncbi:hypothetical protein THAOC_36482, partial [Thalassiosira oceanica]